MKGRLPVYTVTGRLTMDGLPMPDASLLFHPVQKFPPQAPKVLPRARTDEDGKFHVTTYRPGDGAPTGEYVVTVSWRGSLAGIPGDPEDLPEKMPDPYCDPGTSKLKVQVKDGDNALPTWNFAQTEPTPSAP